MLDKQVSVIGLGYMGLPTAAVLANAGYQVTGVDINPSVVEAVNKGETHFAEPGLPEEVTNAHQSGRLRAVGTPEPADIFIIAVPTPVDTQAKTADMSYVRAAAKSIAPVLTPENLVILESTSPMGATEADVRDVILAERPDLAEKIHFAFCPERAIPGDTLRELIHNDRYIGGLTPEATDYTLAFYQTFIKGELHPATARVAELVKLVENTSRDVQIAFANELHYVCDYINVDVREVIRLANLHPRVNIMVPGTGVGGHCIPIDPWFIVQAAPEVTPLMRTAREVNDSKPAWVVGQIHTALKENRAAKVALMGLAYKPNVEDLRESPSLEVFRQLQQQIPAEQLMIAEPHLTAFPEAPLTEAQQAVDTADVIVFLTAHDAFKNLNIPADKTVLDICGVRR